MTSVVCRCVRDFGAGSDCCVLEVLVIHALSVDRPWTQSGQQPLCGSKCLTLWDCAVTLTANDGGEAHEHPVADGGHEVELFELELDITRCQWRFV